MSRLRMGASYAFFALVAAVCVIGIWRSIVDDEPGTVKYLVGVLVFVVATIGFSLSYRPRSNGRLEIEERNVRGETSPTIAYSTTPPILLCLIMGTLGLLLAVGAYELLPEPQTILPLPPESEHLLQEENSEGYGGTAFFGLLAVYFLSFPLGFLAGRLRVGYIAFTSEGIFQRGWAFESFLPWSDIAATPTGYGGHSATLVFGYSNAQWETKRTALVWKIDAPTPRPGIVIDYRKIRDDASLVHEYVTTQITERTGR
ncbi:MAG: hypothetical protein GX610_14350 [Rhodococcus sp.]|nr:hypothetical protein [Rhodococcus sp. (in: high G+C Gram-positive bacteria)]